MRKRNVKKTRRLLLFSYGNIIVMDTFITVDMYIFIVMAFL